MSSAWSYGQGQWIEIEDPFIDFDDQDWDEYLRGKGFCLLDAGFDERGGEGTEVVLWECGLHSDKYLVEVGLCAYSKMVFTEGFGNLVGLLKELRAAGWW